MARINCRPVVTRLRGELEIQHDRGVIYFHLTEPDKVVELNLMTILRVCGVKRPIELTGLIDIKAEQ